MELDILSKFVQEDNRGDFFISDGLLDKQNSLSGILETLSMAVIYREVSYSLAHDLILKAYEAGRGDKL